MPRSRLYTGAGDGGETGLAAGARVRKSSARVEALGAVDEVNACIGLARAQLTGEPDLDEMLDRVQHGLFDLGADLASPAAPMRIGSVRIAELEGAIDWLDSALPPLRAFILPGGIVGAAALHVARTVCRRAERALVRLAEAAEGPEHAEGLIYINRLSDLLFVAARHANRGQGDVPWRQNR
jgi:cob(I)alamin adenosyltransferase